MSPEIPGPAKASGVGHTDGSRSFRYGCGDRRITQELRRGMVLHPLAVAEHRGHVPAAERLADLELVVAQPAGAPQGLKLHGDDFERAGFHWA